jgi:hypothetical protein
MHFYSSALLLIIAVIQVRDSAAAATSKSAAVITDKKNVDIAVGLTGNVAQNGDQQNMVSSSSNVAQNQNVIGVQTNSKSFTNNFVKTNVTNFNNATTIIDKIDNTVTNNVKSTASTVVNNSYQKAAPAAPPKTKTTVQYMSEESKKDVAPKEKNQEKTGEYASSSLAGSSTPATRGAVSVVTKEKVIAMIAEAKKMTDDAFELLLKAPPAETTASSENLTSGVGSLPVLSESMTLAWICLALLF